MGIREMALSLIYRIPMLKSTVHTVRQKYGQVKRDNLFIHLVLSTIEICVYLCMKLIGQVQAYDYKEYLAQLNHYVYTLVTHYITPVLWSQITEVYVLGKHFSLDIWHSLLSYADQMVSRIRGYGSHQTAVNFDSTNMVTMIDLITRSLAELKLKENMSNSLLEVGGYEHEFHDPGIIVEHSSTSCQCDKHQHARQMYTNNNLDTIAYDAAPHQPMCAVANDLETTNTSCSSADENVIAATRWTPQTQGQVTASPPYGKENKDSQTDSLESVTRTYTKQSNATSEYESGHSSSDQHLSASSQPSVVARDADNTRENDVEDEHTRAEDGEPRAVEDAPRAAVEDAARAAVEDAARAAVEDAARAEEDAPRAEQVGAGITWHKLYPTSQPLIPMMTEDKAYELAEALKDKRQDKTGRDAYEVDTVLVLLSQWKSIDEKSKHYAIDRANLLYMAICYGWSYALQKINPTTTAPIVTPPLTAHTNQVTQRNNDHVPVQRQYSNESHHHGNGGAPQAKNLRKNVISRSHGSVYTDDNRPFNNFAFFHRGGDYGNGYYRRSFPPHMSNQHNRYNSGHFYPK